MINPPSKKLKFTKNLIDQGEFKQALQELMKLKREENLTLEEKLIIQVQKGWVHLSIGPLKRALEIADRLYLQSQEVKMPLYSVDAVFLKWMIMGIYGNFSIGMDLVEQGDNILKSIPRDDSLNYHEREANMFHMKAHVLFWQAYFDLAFDNINKCLAFYEQNDPLSQIILLSLILLVNIYNGKGELDLALESAKRALSCVKSDDYLSFLVGTLYRGMGHTYMAKGELGLSLEHHKRSLEIYNKGKMGWWFQETYQNIITVLLAQKNVSQAQNYLQQFKDFLEKNKIPLDISPYQLSQALILKSSGRMRDIAEAEQLLKDVIKNEESPYTVVTALIHLCIWYFQEFQISNKMEILDDIYPLIDQLDKYAIQQNSPALTANVKLLQAKLVLLQLNMLDARKLLVESQQIADEHGLKRLANAISKEHDKLLEELKLWESIKKTKASVSERLKLASVDDVIDRMQGRGEIEPDDPTNEQPLLLLIIGEGGVPIFSFPFTDKWQRDDDLFGSFLSAFNSFSDEYFSQGLDRVKFGDDTLLMQSVNSFSVCYLYKGQTYLAKQKLGQFIETIQNNTSIWETLEKSYESSQVLEITDIPKMEKLLTDIFNV